MERHRGEPRPGWEKIVEGQGMVYGIPGRGQGGVAASVLGRVGALHVLDGRGARRSRPTSRSCTRCAWRPSSTSSPPSGSATSRIPEWTPGRPSRRRGGAATRTSTAASTCATTARGPAKLLEYNADTPTTLLEASILQWHWLQGHPPRRRPVELAAREARRAVGRDPRRGCPATTCYFTWSRGDATGEDHITVGYLQETAAEAGLDTVGLSIEDIGWDAVADAVRRPRRALHVAGVQALPVGVGAHRRLRQARARARSPRRCGWSRCGRRCCPTRRCWRCCGRCTPATPTCCPPTSTSPGCSPSTSASPGSGGRARTSRSSRRARRRRPAASTARRATSTSSSRRCRSSTATGPRWARGSSVTPRRASASARPSGWSPTTARPSFPTASPPEDPAP